MLHDPRQLLVIELHRRHPQPNAADRLDLTTPGGIDDQVARDPQQPPDRGTARRIELRSLLQRPGERFGDHIEHHLRLPHARRHVSADHTEMSIVEEAVIARCAAPQQLHVRPLAQRHTPSTAQPSIVTITIARQHGPHNQPPA